MKLLAFIVLELALAVPAFAQAPAAPPAAAPASDAVVRAVFTTAVADREPADQITSLKNDVPQVYFYTELIDLEGQSVRRGESRSAFRRQSSTLARLVQQEARPELDGRVDRVSSRWLGRDAGAGEAELRKGRTIGLSD